MKEKILVISPHPDDETLGAGGTILRHKKLGDEVYWLNVTNMKEEYGHPKDRILKRNEEIEKVKKSYAFNDFFDLALKPSYLDEYPLASIVDLISEIYHRIKPDTVILPNKEDIHSDHRIVFEAAFVCTKVFRYPYIKKILMMEIMSETVGGGTSRANSFVDISEEFDQKIEIMKIYESEMKPHPFPRSEKALEALALLRGTEAGCRYAEGFFILKEIVKN